MSYLKNLSPAERSMRARLAANVKHSRTDGREATAAARAASPGSDDYWLRVVDPDLRFSQKERIKRARNAKSAYFARLSLAGNKARKAKAADPEVTP